MSIPQLRTFLLGVALTFTLVLPAAAGAGPLEFVKAEQGELVDLLKKPDSPKVRGELDAVFDRILDYDRLARDSLDKHWTERSEAERTEFKDILKRLVRQAYRKNLKKTLDYDVKYEGETSLSDGRLVRTVARSRVDTREQPISVDYEVHQVAEGRWRIRNIVTEGASLVRSYRNQFGRIIRKEGFAALMNRMKKKLDAEGA